MQKYKNIKIVFPSSINPTNQSTPCTLSIKYTSIQIYKNTKYTNTKIQNTQKYNYTNTNYTKKMYTNTQIRRQFSPRQSILSINPPPEHCQLNTQIHKCTNTQIQDVQIQNTKKYKNTRIVFPPPINPSLIIVDPTALGEVFHPLPPAHLHQQSARRPAFCQNPLFQIRVNYLSKVIQTHIIKEYVNVDFHNLLSIFAKQICQVENWFSLSLLTP